MGGKRDNKMKLKRNQFVYLLWKIFLLENTLSITDHHTTATLKKVTAVIYFKKKKRKRTHHVRGEHFSSVETDGRGSTTPIGTISVFLNRDTLESVDIFVEN